MGKIIRLGLAIILFLTPVLILAQSTTPEFTRSLSLGMQGNDVKSLQEFLARDQKIYPEGLITGYFGSKTQEAVKRWQKKYGVDAIGIVGPKTIAKIKEIGQATAPEPAQPTTATPETTTEATSGEPVSPTAPTDITSPTATLAVNVPAPTNVYIQFTPSEEVTAVYEYGLTANYGSVKEVLNQYSSSPAGTYLEDLVSSTAYQVRAKVTDKAGNVGYSQNYSFTTPGVDDAPLLSSSPNVTPSNAAPATAVAVNWETNIPCTGTLFYGPTGAFGNSQTSDYSTTSHSMVIAGLAPGAAYVFNVECATAKKTLESDNFIFVATSTQSSSAISNPFLANILKVLSEVIQRFKIR